MPAPDRCRGWRHAPPLTQLSLPTGSHTITVRNADFAPLVRKIEVDATRPVVIKHRFGP